MGASLVAESGTVTRSHAFPLVQLLKKILPNGFKNLLLGDNVIGTTQYLVKTLATGASDHEFLWKSEKMGDSGP